MEQVPGSQEDQGSRAQQQSSSGGEREGGSQTHRIHQDNSFRKTGRKKMTPDMGDNQWVGRKHGPERKRAGEVSIQEEEGVIRMCQWSVASWSAEWGLKELPVFL